MHLSIVPYLLKIPPRHQARRLALTVHLSETLTRFEGKETMRVNFQTELKVDIDTTDDALRKAFIDLVLAKAREVYGVAGMLAKGQPIVTCSVVDTMHGKEQLPLFSNATIDEDSDSD
jgi:hypothetical protein